MAKVEGLNKLIEALKRKVVERGTNVSVVVGYSSGRIALAVHERREMKWRGLPRDRTVRYASEEERKRRIVRTGYSATKERHIGLFWGPHGRAGFLLDVMREMERELADIVFRVMEKGKKLVDGLLVAGLRLQRESQQNVPVEFGNLRASAFTRVED